MIAQNLEVSNFASSSPGRWVICLISLIYLFLIPTSVKSQVTPFDSTRRIEIVSAHHLRQVIIDSANSLQTLAGDAMIRQGGTTLSGDSIIINMETGIAEVFGNVHINDGDTVHTYAQYLKYIGDERIAYLKKSVRFTDGKAELTTEDLVYNVQTGVATYQGGGKVINGGTLLTSKDAVYYSNTKDVYFKNSVHLVDPKYNITADSLLYNTAFKIATFIARTHIVSKDGVVDTKAGTYNLETGEALFSDRSTFRDSTHSLTGKTVAIDDKTGIVQVEGSGKLVDSANKVIVIGDRIILDRKKNSFLATRKPVMIIYRDNDSTYITADTLFSGYQNKNSTNSLSVSTDSTIAKDSSLVAIDTALTEAKKVPSDSIRLFLGFHHVKIFNDSIQAVSDSLYYSSADSVFRLFKDPVLWNGKSQVTGDTMYLFTKNQKPARLEVFYKSMVINNPEKGIYNQIGGRTLVGYFKDGQIDYVREKGSPAESIFYPQDDDSAYVGMNRSSGDVIDIYFVNKELNKVKFVNDVNGVLYPIGKIPADKKQLEGFIWLVNRRPKSKLDLFE